MPFGVDSSVLGSHWLEFFVQRLDAGFPERTVFTRFITPQRAEEMPGAWRRYYEAWPETTRDRLDVRLLDRAACLRWPGAVITIRQGARMLEDSRKQRLA